MSLIENIDSLQASLNFALLVPETLPSGWQINPTSGSLRLEKPPYNLQTQQDKKPWSNWGGVHNCSYKFEMQHVSGARVRCKQYLYDCGPLSSADHALLYDYYVWKLRHEERDGRVYWHCLDKNAKPILSFQAHGTFADLVITQGFVEKEQLSEIASHLELNPQGEALVQKPFALKSYWQRYPRYDQNLYLPNINYKIPSSFWKLRWPYWQADHIWKVYSTSEVSPDMQMLVEVMGSFNFKPDSLCTIANEERIEEFQVYLRHLENPHLYAWIRRFSANSFPLKHTRFDQPPEVDSFSGFKGFLINVCEHTPIYIASLTKDVGPHDLIWWQGEEVYLIQISPALGFDIQQALRLSNAVADRVADKIVSFPAVQQK